VPRVGFVEDVRERPPARPAREDALLLDGRPSLLRPQTSEQVERFDVGRELGGRTRRGQIGLRRGPVPTGAARTYSIEVLLIAAFIRSSSR
jgi:hypothetical protein